MHGQVEVQKTIEFYLPDDMWSVIISFLETPRDFFVWYQVCKQMHHLPWCKLLYNLRFTLYLATEGDFKACAYLKFLSNIRFKLPIQWVKHFFIPKECIPYLHHCHTLEFVSPYLKSEDIPSLMKSSEKLRNLTLNRPDHYSFSSDFYPDTCTLDAKACTHLANLEYLNVEGIIMTIEGVSVLKNVKTLVGSKYSLDAKRDLKNSLVTFLKNNHVSTEYSIGSLEDWGDRELWYRTESIRVSLSYTVGQSKMWDNRFYRFRYSL
jgi:hypothetical protein